MKDLSYIGLGTAAIGRPQYINIRQGATKHTSLSAFKQKGKSLLEEAYRLGIRYFDTAPGYGMAEQLLMEWLQESNYQDIIIATKWGYTYVANFDPKAKVHEIKEHSIEKLKEQWEVSKALLPAMRYYQIHSATFTTKVLDNEEILNRLAKLKKDFGVVIGLTTTGVQQVEVLKAALEIEKDGERLFDLFQVTYNVFDQSLATLKPLLELSGAKIVIKEALANGRIFPNNKFPNHQAAYAVLEKMSKKYKVGIDGIALRFCIDSLPVFKVLSGAAIKEHLYSNVKAANFELDSSDIEQLSTLAISPQQYWKERKQLVWN